MGDLVRRARDYATRAHRRIDQRRKYTRQPYEVHLKAVANLVAGVSEDPEMVAAAWLHDIVEDTPATVEEVEREFGPGVAGLVAELTDVSRPGDGNRQARKAVDRAHLAAASPRAQTVKLADLIDNCVDICRHDLRFARVYAEEMAALLEVLGAGDDRLRARARKVLGQCRDRLERGPGDEDWTEEEDRTPVERDALDQHRSFLRLFARAFRAADIAEPLRSFDAERPAAQVATVMRDQALAIAGVREGGTVSGYLERDRLGDGACGAGARPLSRSQVLHAESSLAEVVHVLTLHDHCFVTALGEVVGVISRIDMLKPPVRMWLFGLVTLVEIQINDGVRARWPGETWRAEISAARLAKAEALRDERLRRNQPCDLLDCLQISDKAQILLGDPQQLAAFGFETTGSAKRVVKELESLRNHLAHGQDIVSHDWPQIARLARRLADLS